MQPYAGNDFEMTVRADIASGIRRLRTTERRRLFKPLLAQPFACDGGPALPGPEIRGSLKLPPSAQVDASIQLDRCDLPLARSICCTCADAPCTTLPRGSCLSEADPLRKMRDDAHFGSKTARGAEPPRSTLTTLRMGRRWITRMARKRSEWM